MASSFTSAILVALRVLDNLGRFGHLDTRGLVRAGGNDQSVD
jgi:hypothetical protein